MDMQKAAFPSCLSGGNIHYVFFKIYFIDDAITVVPFFFSPLFPSTLYPSTIIPLPQFMSMGRSYKFFGFSISYTILNLPLSIMCLPIMLLIPSPYLFPPLSPSPLITLQVISISVVLFLF